MARSDTRNQSSRITQVRMALEWYIDAGGRVEGPLSTDELNDRAAGGELAPTDSVSADRVTWVPANTVPGLTFPDRPRQPLMETVVSGSLGTTSPPTDPDSDIPPVVAGYQISKKIGVGACGVVYKAVQEKLKRDVALKTVHVPEKASPELLTRFELEARALARLQHPNIVALYDNGMCDTPPGQAFYAMELLNGEDLGARIDRAGPLDERIAWTITRQAAAALAHAAKNGIIHRDVKPANLFLVPAPTGVPLQAGVPMVKITDFGLALSSAEGDQRQSVAGTLLGTPVYMAPEQFAGSNVDARADIYGLGCTVYHALTGAPPFDGRTVWDVMMKKSAPVPRLGPPHSPESADLVASMLAIKPEDRPGDYTELLDRIDALPCMENAQCVIRLPTISGRMPAPVAPDLDSLPAPAPTAPTAPAPPVPSLAPRQRKWVYALAAVGLLAAGAGIAVLAGAFNRPAEPLSDEPDNATHPKSAPVSRDQMLYTPETFYLWVPVSGAGWKIEPDEEKVLTLTGSNPVVRKLNPPTSFRVSLSFDPHLANEVEIGIASSDDPTTATATRWTIRLDRTDRAKATARFGKRVGAGAFEAVGPVVAVPAPQELANSGMRPYLEVRYERVNGKLAVRFRGQPLAEIADSGLQTTELRVEAIGGPIRIDAASLEDLTKK